MKKRRLISLAVLAPVALLCACGGGTPALNLSSNWFKATFTRDEIEGTYERLEYEVSFVPAQEDGYRVEYEKGTYTTTLTAVQETVDGTTDTVYSLRTEFSIAGTFYSGIVASERFEDSTVSEVRFWTVKDSLKPIWSEKTVKSHVPLSTSPKEGEAMCVVYDYKYRLEYDKDLGSAVYKYESAEENSEPYETKVKLGGSGTYLDNEQIFFAMRGLDLESASRFRSVDPQTQSCVSVSVSKATSVTQSGNKFDIFDRSGNLVENVDKEIEANSFTLSYNTKQAGQDRTLVFAKRTSAEENIYRNVPLQISYDIMQNLGRMQYTLIKATFTDR